ncbi:MAG: malonic semialdehyde reductase [Pseudomonadota bacterium]
MDGSTPQEIDDAALATLFGDARTANRFLDKPVGPELLKRLYEVMKWGPTSLNGLPGRFLFLRSEEARERLVGLVMDGNKDRVRSAPVVAIVAYDDEWFAHLPRMFPHAPDMKKMFENNAEGARDNAFRNGTLQGAYMIIAARALGLDCGPMSGFDAGGVDKEFFAGTSYKANFICAIDYADPEHTFPRGPRFAFDEVCKIL